MRKLPPFLLVLVVLALAPQVSGENVTINATATFNTGLGHGVLVPVVWNNTPGLGHGVLVPVVWNNTQTGTSVVGNNTTLSYLFGFHVDFVLKSLNVHVDKNIINIAVTVDRHGFSIENPVLVVYVNNTLIINKTVTSFPYTLNVTYLAAQKGNFLVKAIVDPDNQIIEYNETNNEKTWSANVTANFLYQVIAKASLMVYVKGNDSGIINNFMELFKFWPGGDIGVHFMKLDVEGALTAFFNNNVIPFAGVLAFLMIWGGGVIMAWAYSKEPEFVAIWGLILYLGFKEFITADTYLTLVNTVMVPFAFIIAMMYLKKIFDAFGGG